MTKYSNEFELFWSGFPKRYIESSNSWVKIGKYEASLVWNRLSKKDKAHIMAILPQVRKKLPKTLVPDAHRWLKKRRWEDYDLVRPPEKTKPKEMVQQDKVQEQLARMKDFGKI